MEIIVYEIGVFVVTVILYAVPILTACSFIYEWDNFLKFVMVVISMIEFCALACFVADEADGGRMKHDR